MFTKGGEMDEKLLRPNADRNVAGRDLLLGLKGERSKRAIYRILFLLIIMKIIRIGYVRKIKRKLNGVGMEYFESIRIKKR